MKVKILLLNIVLLTNFVVGQNWKYESGNNVFDGGYKNASIIGKGGQAPYTSPGFIINMFDNDPNNLNIYMSNVGYAGCDNKRAYVKFDNDAKFYSFGISTNLNKDAWFLEKYYQSEDDRISIFSFLQKMKSHSKMYVRLISNCGQTDYEFSLLGSSKAIDFVALKYIRKGKKIEHSFAEAAKEQAKKKEEIIVSLFSGKKLKTQTKYKATIYFVSNDTISYGNLAKGEEIVFSKYSKNKEYCVLHKSTTIELPSDTTFFINSRCLDLECLSRVEE